MLKRIKNLGTYGIKFSIFKSTSQDMIFDLGIFECYQNAITMKLIKIKNHNNNYNYNKL